MNWYYAEDGAGKGPVNEEEFQTLVQAGTITPDTLVWQEGMEEWKPFCEVTGNAAESNDPIPATPSGETPAPESLVFSGRFGDFFKLWIVNVLLTVVTLGIYAAWAKVRTKRYLYANTSLFGHTFEYLANPVRLLIGNIVVVTLFFAYSFGGVISPLIQLSLALLFLPAVPWFVVRAVTFNARYSAWRGLRFHFHGRYGEAFLIYVVLPLTVPFTLGLSYPYVAKRRREWGVSRHAYGTSRFSFTGEAGDFYAVYLKGVLFFLPIVVCYFGFIVLAVAASQNAGATPAPASEFVGIFPLMVFPALFLAFIGTLYLRARLFNLTWANTQLESHAFVPSMKARKLIEIQIVNSIVTVLTFGLMYPWATVRMAEYVVSSLQFIPGGNVDEFVAAAEPEVGAVGEAAADFFDIDIGIGL